MFPGKGDLMIKIFRITQILILLLAANISFSANDNIKYTEGKIYRHVLENGLTIITMERHIAPLVYHQLTYKVGSRNERLGITGISHVVEHMMFKGTEKYTKGKASKIISENSGIFNAFTMTDMTSYYEYMPANKIEIAFDIESDRMMNSIFDPDEFESEIEVIKQERRMRTESSVSGIIREITNSITYKSHPNRDPIIGWPSDLSHITRDDAYKYYRSYYTPNNSILVLVGDFDTDNILKLAEKYYGQIPSGPQVEDVWAYEEPQICKKTFTVYHNDISTPSIRMIFHVPDYEDPDAPAIKLAGMILCEKSRDARLYKRLVNEEQVATMGAGGFGISKDPGLFTITIGLRPESSIDSTENIVWEEIDRMKKEPVTNEELQKVKNRYTFSQVTNYTKNGDIGSRISLYENYFGSDFIDQFQLNVVNVTEDDIIRVMNKYFNQDQVTIGYAFPKGGKTTNTEINNSSTNDFENNPTGFPDDTKFYYKQADDELTFSNNDGRSDLDIIQPIPIAPMIKTMTLDNGIKLNVIENHLVPAVQIIGNFETGIIPVSLQNESPGIPDFLAEVMQRATSTMDYEKLSERMAFVPFSFSVGGSHHGFSFQGYSLKKDSDEMMKTGYELVTSPALNEEDIEKVRPIKLITAKNRFKKTSVKAFYYLYNSILGEHPLTQYNSTVESISKINKESLIEIYQKYFKPENLTLLMVGDMTPEEMRELANNYFGSWKLSEESAEILQTPPVGELTKREIKVFTEPDYTECTINIGFAPYNNIEPDENEIVSVLNYILASSALTSRIGLELRDKQGLIYGIKSELWVKSDRIGYWKFNTKTNPGNTQKVIKGIFDEIKKLLDEGITDEELEAAKTRQLGLLPFYIETPDDVAQITYNMMKDKQPLDYFDRKADRILSVTKEDVLNLAKKYFTLDRYIIVVDGPIEENSLDDLYKEL
jgi:zinc protease